MSLVNFNSLPLDVLGQVVSYLPDYNKMPLMRVNTQTYQLFCKNKETLFPNFPAFKSLRSKFSSYQDDEAVQIYKFKFKNSEDLDFYVTFFIDRVAVAYKKGNVSATFKAEESAKAEERLFAAVASIFDSKKPPAPPEWQLEAKAYTKELDNLTVISMTGTSEAKFEIDTDIEPLIPTVNAYDAKLLYKITGTGNKTIQNYASKLDAQFDYFDKLKKE